jgi:hypothetical protein
MGVTTVQIVPLHCTSTAAGPTAPIEAGIYSITAGVIEAPASPRHRVGLHIGWPASSGFDCGYDRPVRRLRRVGDARSGNPVERVGRRRPAPLAGRLMVLPGMGLAVRRAGSDGGAGDAPSGHRAGRSLAARDGHEAAGRQAMRDQGRDYERLARARSRLI